MENEGLPPSRHNEQSMCRVREVHLLILIMISSIDPLVFGCFSVQPHSCGLLFFRFFLFDDQLMRESGRLLRSEGEKPDPHLFSRLIRNSKSVPLLPSFLLSPLSSALSPDLLCMASQWSERDKRETRERANVRVNTSHECSYVN